MMRHAITEAQVRADTGKPPEPPARLDYTVAGAGGHGRARAAALLTITRAYGCRTVTWGNDASNRPRTIGIIGTESTLAALRVLLPSVEMQMHMAARAAARTYSRELRAAASWERPADRRPLTAAFYRDYLRGYGHGVAGQIERTRTGIAEEPASSGTSTALVLAGDTTRIQAEYTRQFPKLGRPPRPLPVRHSGALRQGHADGGRADLGNRAVGSDRRQITPGP
jgi:hypothetical protein